MAIALLVSGVVNLWAQTDVFKDITTGKITDPSFETTGATVAEKSATGDLTTGWKITAISYARIAIFDNDDVPASNTYGASSPSEGSYYLMVRSNLTDNTKTQNIQQQNAFSLPFGTYKIKYDYKAAKCSSYEMFFTISAKDGGTAKGSKKITIEKQSKNTSYFSSIGWTTAEFDFSLTETKDITLDITCQTRGVTEGHTVILLDNFILQWNLTQSLTNLLSEANTFYTSEGSSYTALKEVIDATNTSETDPDELESQYNALAAALDLAKNHRKPWLTAWATANTNYASETYKNVTGSERSALKTEIDKDEPSTADAYDSAASALTTANSAFTAAKTNYDKYAAEVANATALGVDPVPALDVASNYSDKLKALIVLEDAAVTAGFTQDITARVVDSWSTSNADEKTDAEHWSGESHTYYNRYQDSGFTMYAKKTVSLPAGTYVLKAAARCDKRNEENGYYLGVTIDGEQTKELYTSTSGGTGKGIATNGNANYTEGTFANEGAGYGWEWRFVGFTLVETKEVELKISANILAKGWVSFSDIQLLTTSATEKNVLIKLLNEEITAAAAIDKTTNVGSNVFQIPSSAVEALDGAITAAQGIYDASVSKSSSELEDAIDDLKSAETAYATAELNAPDPTKKYFIKVKTAGHAKLGNAVVVTLGSTSDNNPTGYTFNASNEPADYLCQAFTFTQVSGNTYKISINRPEGVVYLTNGTANGSAAGWKAAQIQGTTDAEKAMVFTIKVSPNDGAFNIYNSETNSTIACQDAGNIYTEAGNADFAVAEASEARVDVAAKAGKYGTIILPFAYDFSSDDDFDGITFYSIDAIADGKVTLAEVATPAANTPYIIKNDGGSNFSKTLTGYGTAKQASYADANGYLIGVYTDSELVPENSYVLQTQDGKQAFYIVESSFEATPYRCYLSAGVGGVKAFFFDGDETAVSSVKADEQQGATIYNLAGQRVSKAQKGVYIINGKKVAVK